MAYYKVEIEYRNVLKAELYKIGKAQKNIFGGMIKAREQTIADMKEHLNDDSLYLYAHEHSAANRPRSNSQVRETHGADHFKFLKATQPIGQVVAFNVVMIANPDDEDGVGNILLRGAMPHPINPQKLTGWLQWTRGGYSRRAQHVEHPGHPSYAEYFNQWLIESGRQHYNAAMAELIALGDGIFKQRTFSTALQVSMPGEQGLRDISKSDYIVRFPAGMYDGGGE